MSNSQAVSSFERFIFAATRLLIALAAFGAITGIVACTLFLAGQFDKPTTVSYEEVKQALSKDKPSEGANTPEQPEETTPAYNLPPNLKPYFSTDNGKVLDGWMRSIDSEQNRTEFLTELSAVVKGAEADGKDITAVINKYKSLKLPKIAQSQFDRIQGLAAKAGVAAALFGLVFLLVILSLALVLMAIERHGRRIDEGLRAMQEGTAKIETNTRAAALALRPKAPHPPPSNA